MLLGLGDVVGAIGKESTEKGKERKRVSDALFSWARMEEKRTLRL